MKGISAKLFKFRLSLHFSMFFKSSSFFLFTLITILIWKNVWILFIFYVICESCPYLLSFLSSSSLFFLVLILKKIFMFFLTWICIYFSNTLLVLCSFMRTGIVISREMNEDTNFCRTFSFLRCLKKKTWRIRKRSSFLVPVHLQKNEAAK